MAGVLLAAWLPLAAEAQAPAPPAAKPSQAMTVYRSPTCSCCGKWIEHVKAQGFTVEDIKSGDMDQVKDRLGVPEALRSCHTASVGGYVVEGHVPAADILDLLKQKPKDAAGLAVPGMPAGTPGMEMGGRKDPFDVVEFDKQGKTRVRHEYRNY
jgi:hypothetical protein